MVRIIVDPTTELRFTAVRNITEVCDEAGNVIGVFVPEFERQCLDPGVSDEELDRRLREEGGRPWAEIRADLEKSA